MKHFRNRHRMETDLKSSFRPLFKPSISDENDPIVNANENKNREKNMEKKPIGHEINQMFASLLEMNTKDVHKVNGWGILPCNCGLCNGIYIQDRYDPIAYGQGVKYKNGELMLESNTSRFRLVKRGRGSISSCVAQFIINWRNVERWNRELTDKFQ